MQTQWYFSLFLFQHKTSTDRSDAYTAANFDTASNATRRYFRHIEKERIESHIVLAIFIICQWRQFHIRSDDIADGVVQLFARAIADRCARRDDHFRQGMYVLILRCQQHFVEIVWTVVGVVVVAATVVGARWHRAGPWLGRDTVFCLTIGATADAMNFVMRFRMIDIAIVVVVMLRVIVHMRWMMTLRRWTVRVRLWRRWCGQRCGDCGMRIGSFQFLVFALREIIVQRIEAENLFLCATVVDGQTKGDLLVE